MANYTFYSPTKEELMASKAPENPDMVTAVSCNRLDSVCREDNLLFINTYYSYTDKNIEYSFTLQFSNVFDIKTGNMLEFEQLFKDVDEVKQLVSEYAGGGGVDWDSYNWHYDGVNFIINFGLIGEYDDSVNIPAVVIRPYFV